MATTTTVKPQLQFRKSYVRKATNKPKAVQTAIAVRVASGQSKSQIARDLGIARNTVGSIVELNNVEQQLEDIRNSAVALGPAAVRAIESDLATGNGTLGIRLLEGIGAIGDNAIRQTRDSARATAGAINVLVQAGANVNVAPGAQVKKDDS